MKLFTWSGIWAAALLAGLLNFARTPLQRECLAGEVMLEDLRLTVPEGWKQQRPSNNLRLGQFEIPAADGDTEPGELGIFNFGFGGGVKENVTRWIGQFDAAERRIKVTEGESPQGKYVFVDVGGTYKKPIGPPVQQRTQPAPGYRMLGVILAIEKKGNYFLKLVGPEKTVTAAAEAFRTSFGGNAGMEKTYDPEKPE